MSPIDDIPNTATKKRVSPLLIPTRQERQRARFIERDRKIGQYDPAYQIITRAIHERGERQTLALAHLKARGLWLTVDQKRQAGLIP